MPAVRGRTPGSFGQAFTPLAISGGGVAPTFHDYGEWRRLINPNDYHPAVELFFEAIIETSDAGKSVYARLYNITDGAPVAGSQVETAQTSGGDRKRSGPITLPAADKEYRAQRGGVSGGTYYCYGADVIWDTT